MDTQQPKGAGRCSAKGSVAGSRAVPRVWVDAVERSWLDLHGSRADLAISVTDLWRRHSLLRVVVDTLGARGGWLILESAEEDAGLRAWLDRAARERTLGRVRTAHVVWATREGARSCDDQPRRWLVSPRGAAGSQTRTRAA
jgi:hypothetical protein